MTKVQIYLDPETLRRHPIIASLAVLATNKELPLSEINKVFSGFDVTQIEEMHLPPHSPPSVFVSKWDVLQ